MDTLTTLFSHNLWANLKLLEVCTEINDEELNSTLDGTYGSIRDTLVHIARAERAYMSRISTGQPYTGGNAGLDSLAQIRESLRTTGEGFIEWASKVTADETVVVDWDGTLRDVPKTILLTQAINHATEHRAQIMTILTQLGFQPPELSGWEYFDETGE